VIDLLLPPDVRTAARRVSALAITLAVLVVFLFPASARAGTEVPFDRWATGGLLLAVGLALRFLPAHTFLVLVLHGALQLFLGAPWAAVFTGGAVGYAALGMVRLRRSGARAEPSEDEGTMHAADILRENVESIVMALIIALACREFLYEAFLIPTASMQPTILGKAPREGREQGDRLLATKVPLLFGDPPRWSIVVFKYPLYRRVNYIKRLVGLPGEHVEIRRGDVYVDGACVAKPEEVQDQLWFAEYPVAGQPRPLSLALTRDDQNAEWDLQETGVTADVPDGVSSLLFYDETLDDRDTDLRIGARVDPADVRGAVLFRIDGASRRVELAIDHDSARLRAPGIEEQALPGVALPSGGGRVTLGVADRVVRVWIDGHLVARVPHADETNGGLAQPRASIGLTGARATFSDVRVDRDLQYSKTRTWDIPDDGFVMLGDNTLSSKDSREWDVNVVTTADGRTYAGESSVKLEDESTVTFRTVRDDATGRDVYEFVDVDGILRRIPVEGSTLERGVPRPYVRRRDLIGRAFVTFFPFPPFGDLRLHFLP